MLSHQQIAEAVLGCSIEPGGYCPCPGAHLHHGKTGRRDFRIIFDPDGKKMPSSHCFHSSCEPERHTAMVAIIRAIRAAEKAAGQGTIAPTPHRKRSHQPTAPAKPTLNRELAERVAMGWPASAPQPTRGWLRAISPLQIPADPSRWGELFLDTLYSHKERILIFTEFASQGQMLRVCGEGNYKLSPTPGRKATPCTGLPARAHDGAWFLTAPVTGKWAENPNNLTPTGVPKLGRRHAACCVRFPYAVIESDVLPEAVWLRILGQLHDPIVAVYTSGGKSVHALIRINAGTVAEFNTARAHLLHRLTPLGADAAAITPVRLSRLPGCLRLSKGETAMQELLYLNPHARPGEPLASMPLKR